MHANMTACENFACRLARRLHYTSGGTTSRCIVWLLPLSPHFQAANWEPRFWCEGSFAVRSPVAKRPCLESHEHVHVCPACLFSFKLVVTGAFN